MKLKEEEQELRKGLGIFRIDHPFSKEIQNLEKVSENENSILILYNYTVMLKISI